MRGTTTVSVTDTQSRSALATVAMPIATPAVTFGSLTKSNNAVATFTCMVKPPEIVVGATVVVVVVVVLSVVGASVVSSVVASVVSSVVAPTVVGASVVSSNSPRNIS